MARPRAFRRRKSHTNRRRSASARRRCDRRHRYRDLLRPTASGSTRRADTADTPPRLPRRRTRGRRARDGGGTRARASRGTRRRGTRKPAPLRSERQRGDRRPDGLQMKGENNERSSRMRNTIFRAVLGKHTVENYRPIFNSNVHVFLGKR